MGGSSGGDNALHVLQAISASGPGGITQVALDYALALTEHGVTVTTVADLPASERVCYRELGLALLDGTNIIKWWFAFHPGAVRLFRRYIADHQIAAVIVHNGRAQPFFQRVLRKQLPLITVCHTGNIDRRLDGDAVFCVNQRIADDARRALAQRGRRADRVFVVPNPLPVPPDEVAGIGAIQMRRFGDEEGFVRVGTLGQLVENKGVALMLQAVHQLRERGCRVRAVIGGDGPERNALGRLVKQLGLEDAVRFCGWVIDKRAFFDQIDIFCLPSLSEPFGLVVTEAMAYGRPVVASDADGPREIVTDGVTGMLFPRGDSVALSARLRELCDGPDRAVALALAARELILQRYGRDSIGLLLKRTIEAVTSPIAT